MKKTCVRCDAAVKTNGHLCLTCSADWVWCSYKGHVVARWTERRSSTCPPCSLEYQRLRRGLPELTCSFPDCKETFGGSWMLRSVADPLCPDHRKTHRWCRECKELLPVEGFKKNTFCQTCMPVVSARTQLERKRFVLTAYSASQIWPKCVCCGEMYLGHLSIQHVNGDGAAARSENCNADSYTHLAALLRRGIKKDGLVTMCMNCNLALGTRPGVRCPNPAHAGPPG